MNMNKQYLLQLTLCFMILLFMAGCEVSNPVTDNAMAPELSALSAPVTLYLGSPDKYTLQVRAKDPQGISDIAAVIYWISNEEDATVLSDSLHDDGQGGDMIVHDGLFFDSLSVDFAQGTAGSYVIYVQATDLSGNKSNLLDSTITAVNEAVNRGPLISNAVAPDTLVEGIISNVFVSIQVDDADGLQDIDSVFVSFYPPLSPVPFLSVQLKDDGSGADASPGDGVFSGELDLSDDAPVLSDLVAPVTISRLASEPVLLSVRATDAQGQDDIQSVYFNTTKPDGTPSLGNPFPLFDNGDEENHGDEAEGDGIYSTLIVIDSQNALGQYRFDFIAEDYSNTSWDNPQGLFRFQAVDKSGRKSSALVLDTVVLLEDAVFDTLTHYMTVVD